MRMVPGFVVGTVTVLWLSGMAEACPDPGTQSQINYLRNSIGTIVDPHRRQAAINDYNRMVDIVNRECHRRAQQEAIQRHQEWQRQQQLQQQQRQQQLQQTIDAGNRMIRETNYARAKEAFEQARQAMQAGDWTSAVAGYERAISHLSANGDHQNMAIAQGQLETARDRLRQQQQGRSQGGTSSGSGTMPGLTPSGTGTPPAQVYTPPPPPRIQNSDAKPPVPAGATTQWANSQDLATLGSAIGGISQGQTPPTSPQAAPRPECQESDDARWANRSIDNKIHTAEELVVAQKDFDRRRALGCFK